MIVSENMQNDMAELRCWPPVFSQRVLAPLKYGRFNGYLFFFCVGMSYQKTQS